jgi:hypothetical protein
MESMKPGATVLLRRSSTRVSAPTSPSSSALEPTATMRPSRTATASAIRSPVSTVITVASRRIRSA